MKLNQKGVLTMKQNKIDSFNKSLAISKIPLFDISSMGGEIDFSLSYSDIKTNISKQKIDSAVFTLPLGGGGVDNNIYAAVCVPVFPPSEEKPDSLMVMAGKNTSRFFDVKFLVAKEENSFSEIPEFEPSETQRKLIISHIDKIENEILKNAATASGIDYAYAEPIKNNVFDKNGIEFFKIDLFKFSPSISSLSAEIRTLLESEVSLAKKNIAPSGDLGM